MDSDVTFRRITADDPPALAEIEYLSHLGVDPDFGVERFGPHGWTAADIEACLLEERTRGWLVEERADDPVAYFVYEVMDDHYAVRRLLVHPDYRRGDFGRTILHALYQRIARSATRKRLVAAVREDDLETCTWLAHVGFKSRLVRGGWGDDLDAVEFTFETAEQLTTA